MTNPAKFWNKVASKYARDPIPDEAVYAEKLRLTREHLTSESRVCELACGTGSTAIAHAPFVKTIDALDISDAMLAIAKDKAKHAKTQNITFQTAGIEDFAAPHAHYDAVLAMSILHLLPDHRGAIVKCYDMLKSGGVFISSTPCLLDKLPLLRFVFPLGYWFRFLPYVKFFGHDDLRSDLRAAGFDIIHDWQPTSKKSWAVFMIAQKP